VFLGGTEKIRGEDLAAEAEALYGLPVLLGDDPVALLMEAIERFAPALVVDLSDEPVVGYRERFRYISHVLARNVAYLGSDFHFSPPRMERLSTSPSLSIIGTAKRVGKTAVSGYVARAIEETLPRPKGGGGVVIVPMGRGGPAEPEIIDGLRTSLGARELLAWSREGRHAASDHFEDAALSRVTTVGCRRCGGGMAGQPFFSNVAEGARIANTLAPALTIFEGSGAAIPPVATDACLCVAGANQPREYVTGYLGTYRLLLSDAVVLTMAEEPLADAGAVRALIAGVRQVRPDAPVLPVVLRPRPMESVDGRRVAYFSTAPFVMEGVLRDFLEDRWGCRVSVFSPHLSNRRLLREDLGRPEMSRVELVMTEIKAAAIDVVAEWADARGLPVVLADNDPVEVPPGRPGELRETCMWLAEKAIRRRE
jgi:cyclic 2,3-diphosphoglycerate synthetase